MMGHVGDAQGVIDPARFKADGLEGLIFGRRDKDIFPFQPGFPESITMKMLLNQLLVKHLEIS